MAKLVFSTAVQYRSSDCSAMVLMPKNCSMACGGACSAYGHFSTWVLNIVWLEILTAWYHEKRGHKI